jgi:hypothetical protein
MGKTGSRQSGSQDKGFQKKFDSMCIGSRGAAT